MVAMELIEVRTSTSIRVYSIQQLKLWYAYR